MKSIYPTTRFVLFAGLLLLVVVSCQKTDKSPTQTTDAQMQALLISATNAAFQAGGGADGQEAVAEGSSCKVVTYVPSKDVYPHKTIVDFGSGCTGSDGVTRRGKKIITFYADPDSAPVGTMFSETNFREFYMDDIRVTGLVQSFVEATGQYGLSTEKDIVFKHFKSPNGDAKTWKATHFSKQVEGYSTKTRDDDVFEITGNSDGNELAADGTIVRWVSVISDQNPLIRQPSCFDKVKGSVDVVLQVISGGKGTFTETLNYGDGACDNNATLSINGGTPQDITLPLYFWPVK